MSRKNLFVADKFTSNVLIKNHYCTHTSPNAEFLHKISEAILWPPHSMLHLLARILQPNPGAYKDNTLRGIAIRAGAITGVLLISLGLKHSYYFRMASLFFGVAMPMTGYFLRMMDHQWRPLACYLINKKNNDTLALPKMDKANPLHIRTHNVGFVPTTIGIITDLRPAIQRAKELIDFIIKDNKKPDIIFFQEAALFNEDATSVFVKGLSTTYPYIIYNVGKNVLGFSSGAMVASRYPIKFEDFYPFKHMVATEKAAPRGILLVSIETQKGKLMIANVHTQSLLGERRARARHLQLQDIYKIITSRSKEENCHAVVVGDFNTSRITAWGEDNLSPQNQAERSVLTYLAQHFDDPYLNDHDPITGKRNANKPNFLEVKGKDNTTTEPNGTWHYGPFASPGLLMNLTSWLDRKLFGREAPKPIFSYGKPSWGTTQWDERQAMSTARFDYVLFPKIPDQQQPLNATVEIRRIIHPEKKESAASDHLPVDALITKL